MKSRRICLVAIAALLSLTVAVVYFQLPNEIVEIDSKDFGLGLDNLVDLLFRRCSQKNIRFRDVTVALGQTRNCLNINLPKPDIGEYDYESFDEDITPVDENELVRTVRDGLSMPCQSWSASNDCLTPLLHIFENCFGRLGFFTEVFELLFKLSCANQLESKLSKSLQPAFLSWSCPDLDKSEGLRKIAEPCIHRVQAHRNYYNQRSSKLLCNDVDYEEVIRYSAGRAAQFCNGKQLELTVYNFLTDAAVKSFIQDEILECA